MASLVTDYFNYVDLAILGFFNAKAAALSAALIGPVTIMLGFSFTMFALGMIMGKFEMPIQEFLWRFGKAVLICYLGLAAGAYSGKIANAIYAVPGDLVAVVTSGGSKAPNMVIDNALEKGLALAVAFKNLASGWSPGDALGLYLTALVILIGTVLICAIAAALILLTKFMLGILLAFGTLAILCLLFNWSHKIFDGWMSQVLNYVMMFVMLSMVVGLLFAMWSAGLTAAKADVSNGWSALLPAIFNGVVAILVLRQIEFMTRGIFGGWHIITPNVLGGLRNMARPVTNQARSAGGWAVGAAGTAARSAGRGASRAWNAVVQRFSPSTSSSDGGSGRSGPTESEGRRGGRRQYDATPEGAVHTHQHSPGYSNKGNEHHRHDSNNNVDTD